MGTVKNGTVEQPKTESAVRPTYEEWDNVPLPFSKCLVCSGDGQERSIETNEPIGPCPLCQGQGAVRISNPRRSEARPDELIGDEVKMEICTKCSGDGLERSELTDEPLGTCPECRGDGVLTVTKNGFSLAKIGTRSRDGLRVEHVDSQGERMQCLDEDCEGWLYVIDGADMLECGKCGALHDLDGEFVDDDDDDPPTPEEWAEDFEAMDDEGQTAGLRMMGKTLGIPDDMMEMLIAQKKGGES